MADPDLRVLSRFLPDFEQADFSPGDWTEMQKQEDGVYTMPYATLSPAALEFVRAAYDGGWVLQDFSWPEWKDTDEAIALYRDPDLLAQATPRQLAQLLTVFIRQGRFVEGGLLGNFESRHILAIVRRAAKLLEAAETPLEP
jgi:hypothetical protein